MRTCSSGTPRTIPGEQTSWSIVWEADSPAAGKISIYDSPIYIADAAVYLMATQPDLEITNPYELDETQFNAAVELLKQQKEIAGEYWSDCRESDPVVRERQRDGGNDVAVPGEPAPGRKSAGAGPGNASRGGVDRLVGHVDDRFRVENPNCMYLWMDYIISPEANAAATEYFGEAPVSEEACGLTQDPNHCDDVPCDGRGVLLEGLLLEHSRGRLRRRPRRGLQGLLRVDAGLDRDTRLGIARTGGRSPAPRVRLAAPDAPS